MVNLEEFRKRERQLWTATPGNRKWAVALSN